MNADHSDLSKLIDLRIAAALEPLSREEAAELARLELAYPDVDAESFERAMAAILEASISSSRELPDAVRARVVANADRYFGHERARDFDAIPFVSKPGAQSGSPVATNITIGRTVPHWMGWAVAAALGVVAVALWWNRPSAGSESDLAADAAQEPSSVDTDGFGTGELGPRSASADGSSGPDAGDADAANAARALANARFTLRRAWSPGNDAAGQRVSGDVVWDGDAQRGYLRLKNLRRNDPTVEQYQLWIFDASRDERYPIDGGVFDVQVDDDGTAVIPINARVPVKTPTLFAVTLERPGGVVVSDRSRIVALARI